MSFPTDPAHASYDVVIVGGAIMGSSTAWWLKELGFPGRVLVVERDPSYAACASTLTNSCIRQQFSDPLNIRMSQFTAAFIANFRERIGDERVPDIVLQSYGYIYLADSQAFADILRANQKVQVANGAGTRIRSPEDLLAEYPFYNLDGILCGSHNKLNEGYWDGGTVFEWFRRSARDRGTEYVSGEVVAMERQGGRIVSVTLASGQVIACGHVVNASGTRGALTAARAGIVLPIEPRKRFSWVFTCPEPLGGVLPLTIDPSGVHMRQDGPETFLCGCPPDPDPAVAPDDLAMDRSIFEDFVWPVLATRVPAFERVRIVNEWACNYDYNTLDQNAICGPHPEVSNFLFLNGFSGHGLQQSPAMGRGTAEWIAHGDYRAMDLRPFWYDRVVENRPMLETAII
jgi:glycine/D-amino acid oxidase-like deaminating enzyme